MKLLTALFFNIFAQYCVILCNGYRSTAITTRRRSEKWKTSDGNDRR